MIVNYSLQWQKEYLPYVIVDENGTIVDFEKNMPDSAKEAAKNHLEMSEKFDDVSNYPYYDNLLEKLRLK